MPYADFSLPSYPVERDMWDYLAEDTRPIMVYGMGNGADKLFARLSEYGLSPTEVFASDGFVRGHYFRGYKVKSFSEIKSSYDDFIILLSFASNRSEVIEMLTNICKTNEILVPDMPVAGADYFDKAFYNSHYSEIKAAYDSLSDDISKSAFAAIVNYKLFGKMEYLLNCYSPVDSLYELIPENIEIAIDAGAYNGDTLREILSYRKDIKKIYAVEPDKRNFKKLSRYIEEAALSDKAEAICAAVWSENSSGVFIGSGNRNSSVSSTASHESREEETRLLAIDSISAPYVDYIKLDVEGAELAALEGARKTIEKHSPTLLISAYHRSEDIFSLVLYMRKNHPDYSLYIRRTLCLPAWEIALVAVNHKNG